MLVMCPESNNATSHICPAHPQKPWLLPPLLTTASDTSGLSLSPYLSSAPPHRTTKTSSRVRTGPGGAPRHPDVQPLSFPQHPFSARHRASRVIQPSCPCSSGNEHPQLPSRQSQLPRPWYHSTSVSDLQHTKPIPTGLLSIRSSWDQHEAWQTDRHGDWKPAWAGQTLLPSAVALIRWCCGLFRAQTTRKA